jgi:mannose-6-phosphate isomerase-like protein (cupin superfamily)
MLNTSAQGFRIGRHGDRFGERHDLGIGGLTFKVVGQDCHGGLLAVELAHHTAGGPPRHVHHEQDEWFYVLEGQYLVEVGGELFRLESGDSAFGPRAVPHTWAFAGGQQGRMMFVVTPAGQLEAFLRELSRMGAMAPQDPAFWPPYGMELVGPPLDLGSGMEG